MLNSRIILDGLVFPELREAGPLNTADQPPALITYSFHDTATRSLADHEAQVVAWTSWTDDQRDIVRGALAELESFLNVEFLLRARNRPADIPIGLVEEYRDGSLGGQVYYSFRYSGSELVDFEASMSVLKDADRTTYYHELGHALGLKHPFEGPTKLPGQYDNYGYTVMSYDRSYNPDRVVFDTTPGGGEYRRLDVIALQSIWGAADSPMSFAIGDFGTEAGGWASQTRFPRQMGDVDGDGRDDIVGFGIGRVFVARAADTDGFVLNGDGLDNFASDQGWVSDERFPRLLADIDGDGRDDIIGFGARTTFTALSDGTGGFGGFGAGIDNFARAQGWRSADQTPRVAGDVNGDGIDDIIGFGAQRTFTALGTGDGRFTGFRTAIEDFSQAQGWTSNAEFLRLAGDVNGDGLDDIIGFGGRGTYTALARGDGTFFGFRLAISDFSKAQGWGDNDRTPRLIGDVNGDGRADIVGFGFDIVYAALGTSQGRFAAPTLLSNDFTLAGGWDSNDRLPRQLADVNGDGLDDLIGFSEAGVLTRLTELDGDNAGTRRTADLLDDGGPGADWFEFG